MFGNRFMRVLFALAAAITAVSANLAHAATVEEIALMKSPNREKILIEGAKKVR